MFEKKMMGRRRSGRGSGEIAWAAVAAALACGGFAFALCEEDKLLATDGVLGDWYGAQVAMTAVGERELAIIGAPLNQEAGPDAGAAYICEFDTVEWIETAKLLPPIGYTEQYFGAAVAIDGDVAVVGSGELLDEWTMSADVFRYDGEMWVAEAHLPATSKYVPSVFAATWVGVSGDVAVVGVWADDTTAQDAGAVYVYRCGDGAWAQEAKLLASDGAAGDYFGISVSIQCDLVIVGAYRDDDNGVDSGSAYVFRYDGLEWVEETKLLASDGAGGDRYGISVAVNGDAAVVGAFRHDLDGADAGASYVYRRQVDRNGNGLWYEEAALVALDGEAGDEFGSSVGMGIDELLVGASRDDDSGFDAGSAYFFECIDGVWIEQGKVLAPDGSAGDRFGYAVSVLNSIAMIGSRFDDDNGEDSGSAHAFDLRGADCNENGVCDWVDLLEGTSEDCNENGIPDECDIADGTSLDCQPDGIPDECQLIDNDCNENGVPDECDIADGTSEDCNGNGRPDECDIADGTSEDCQPDGVPDECQLGENDCNANGVPDDCDIADGTSEDVNGNGIPDECECLCDVNGDDVVDVLDLLSLFGVWGESGVPEDVNFDGVVDVLDLLKVLDQWGPCPHFQ